MTATELLNQIDLIRLQLVNVIETRPEAPLRAYISDCDGNMFDFFTVKTVALEVNEVEGDITLAILSDELGEFING